MPLEDAMDTQSNIGGGGNSAQIHIESATPPPLLFDNELATSSRPRSPLLTQSSPDCIQIRQESMSPPRVSFNDEIACLGKQKTGPGIKSANAVNIESDDLIDEEWEAELDECLAPNLTQIRGWDTLHTQIKEDLEKKFKSLPLSQINQLMILRNFATLRLRGLGRIEASKDIGRQWHQELEGSSDHFAWRIRALARHYQIFEQLP